MRLTSVVLTSWISSVTSKISWIVGWSWSNHVYVCVWVCICVCLQFDTWAAKTNIGIFLSGNLDFGLEKSWKNHGTFFWDFCGNPASVINTLRPEQNGDLFANDIFKYIKFLNWKLLYFDSNFTEFDPEGLLDNNPWEKNCHRELTVSKIEIFIGYFWMRWVVIRAGIYCPHSR